MTNKGLPPPSHALLYYKVTNSDLPSDGVSQTKAALIVRRVEKCIICIMCKSWDQVYFRTAPKARNCVTSAKHIFVLPAVPNTAAVAGDKRAFLVPTRDSKLHASFGHRTFVNRTATTIAAGRVLSVVSRHLSAPKKSRVVRN